MLVGSGATIGLGAVTTVPVVLELTVRTYRRIASGRLADPWFWDLLVAAMAIVSQFAVFVILALRDHRRSVIRP